MVSTHLSETLIMFNLHKEKKTAVIPFSHNYTTPSVREMLLVFDLVLTVKFY